MPALFIYIRARTLYLEMIATSLLVLLYDTLRLDISSDRFVFNAFHAAVA